MTTTAIVSTQYYILFLTLQTTTTTTTITTKPQHKQQTNKQRKTRKRTIPLPAPSPLRPCRPRRPRCPRRPHHQQADDERCHQFRDSSSGLESSSQNSLPTRNTVPQAVFFGPRTNHGPARSSNACPSSPISLSSSSLYSVLPTPHISSPPFFF
jgi:Ca2+/H+ antiporter